jgi:membrane dipeptidase
MRLIKYSFILFVAFGLLNCASKKPLYHNHLAKANILAQKYIIVDGHVDLPYRLKVSNFRLEKEFTGIPIESKEGDFDYVRAKKGGLDAPFMSIYIPSSRSIPEARLLADSLINMVNYIAQENPSYYEVARTPTDVKRIKAAGKIALPMGMENGSPIEILDDIRHWREKGISYVTLTHGKDNQISDSSYDTTGTWQGLSPFGYEVVTALSNNGIMIDVSHISDKAFFDVFETASVPLLASHSSARAFTPGFERNMSDDIIKAMGKNKGVIMINFGSTFLDGEIEKKRTKQRNEIMELLAKAKVKFNSPEGKAIIAEYRKKNPEVYSDVYKVADHIDHIVKLTSVDQIGFGSDYDGVGDSLPTGLKDAEDYPNLIAELLRRGYSDQDIEKMCYGNLFRVWQATLDYANPSRQN